MPTVANESGDWIPPKNVILVVTLSGGLDPACMPLRHRASMVQIDTVDGSEIRRSPVDMENFPLFTGFYTFQVVQDFFHQLYDTFFSVLFFDDM